MIGSRAHLSAMHVSCKTTGKARQRRVVGNRMIQNDNERQSRVGIKKKRQKSRPLRPIRQKQTEFELQSEDG